MYLFTTAPQQYQGLGHLGCMNASTGRRPQVIESGEVILGSGFPLPFSLLPSTPGEDDRLDQACGSLLPLSGKGPLH